MILGDPMAGQASAFSPEDRASLAGRPVQGFRARSSGRGFPFP